MDIWIYMDIWIIWYMDVPVYWFNVTKTSLVLVALGTGFSLTTMLGTQCPYCLIIGSCISDVRFNHTVVTAIILTWTNTGLVGDLRKEHTLYKWWITWSGSDNKYHLPEKKCTDVNEVELWKTCTCSSEGTMGVSLPPKCKTWSTYVTTTYMYCIMYDVHHVVITTRR